MRDFKPGAFINCPFTDDFKEKLEIIVFCTLSAGYEPVLTLRDGDNSKNRLNKLVEIIGAADISIHDLSFCKCKCAKRGRRAATEYYRMNMPFELGLALYDSLLHKKKRKGRDKKILVLESEQYELQKALSDASNIDPVPYYDQPQELLKVVCHWFDKMGIAEMRNYDMIAKELFAFKRAIIEKAISLGRTRDEALTYINSMSIDGWIKEAAEWLQGRKA